jgi:hypothetical protein
MKKGQFNLEGVGKKFNKLTVYNNMKEKGLI